MAQTRLKDIDNLLETPEVDYTHRSVVETANKLFQPEHSQLEKIECAFTYVRDQIHHSWDIQDHRVTCASDVLQHRSGICYAKSNLLAALLRKEGFPTGFCYQRLILFDQSEIQYCIHALNAVYLAERERWVRLDARGNKAGIDAQFSPSKEQLAFTVQANKGEVDYPIIYTDPTQQRLTC